MDILKSKTVTGYTGSNSVGAGIPLANIIKVSRQGEQKDNAGLVSISSLNGSNWVFISPTKRIVFGSNYPFTEDELIHIIYKL